MTTPAPDHEPTVTPPPQKEELSDEQRIIGLKGYLLWASLILTIGGMGFPAVELPKYGEVSLYHAHAFPLTSMVVILVGLSVLALRATPFLSVIWVPGLIATGFLLYTGWLVVSMATEAAVNSVNKWPGNEFAALQYRVYNEPDLLWGWWVLILASLIILLVGRRIRHIETTPKWLENP